MAIQLVTRGIPLAGGFRSCLTRMAPAIALLLGCEPAPTVPNGRTVVSHLEWDALTPEGDTTRHLLTVGDTGYAMSTAVSNSPDCYNPPPCYAEAEVEFQSSDQSVVSPGRQSMGESGGILPFVARGQGSAYVRGVVQRFAESTLVVVVGARLPIDSVRVRAAPPTSDSLVEIIADAAGNVQSITLPIGHSVALRILAFRGGDSTVYLPTAFASSDSAVVWVWTLCRVGWMACATPGAAFVSPVAAGTASVTATARDRQYVLQVTAR